MKNDFISLGIDKDTVKRLNQSGIVEPTAIQQTTIPILLTGKDVIGQAQTGTGKTLAFLLPIMHGIDVNNSFVQALIVTPTRELAIQITSEAKKLATSQGINVLAAYGGQDVEAQIRKLKKSIHIVIGTPGRLLDHLRRKTINFSKLDTLVLDEADQMLQMGFLKEVEEIINHTPKSRQTMLFSATMPKEISSIASRYMQKPNHIRIQKKKIILDEIKQLVIETTDRDKQNALFEIIDQHNPFMAIIFCRTKRRAIVLNEALQSAGYNSDEIHGDLSQAKRERVMKAFRETKIQLLVATDVAARGLDIEGITHIFNYDIPQDAESYIHRIGRTGRAGQRGIAITFVTPKDRNTLTIIEKEINFSIQKQGKPGEKSHTKNRTQNISEKKRNTPQKSEKNKDSKYRESRKSDMQKSRNERPKGQKRTEKKPGASSRNGAAKSSGKQTKRFSKAR